ncbi:AbrB/MazE/SpoVT family DNA-binding domain-containing protein [Alkalibacillus salilacus]|uniref:Antitoxin MazE n=1 Tax=Alkalibacillus salilacus TaxID=284582 RepID=A0ABT9VJ04_9BACI|nr:AbrB/MazE/SpoVT family DNA-binding domain-containing protein [Alkalibacillus salilacus]MDQ0160785.1 antitoxin MazE [Alkalibacillus salilacus]
MEGNKPNQNKGDFKVTKTITKWGNSLGVRIPHDIAHEHGLTNGSNVTIRATETGIVIEPVEKDLSLEDMLSQINNSNRHEEIDFGNEGKELL